MLYKNRDSSEQLFCGDKSFLGNRSLRVYGNKKGTRKSGIITSHKGRFKNESGNFSFLRNKRI